MDSISSFRLSLGPSQRVLALLLVIGLIGAGTPAYFGVTDSVSLQSIWTSAAALCLAIVLWRSRRSLPDLGWFLWLASVIFLVIHLTVALLTAKALNPYSYLFALPLAIGGFLVGSSTRLGQVWRDVFYWASAATAIAAPVFLMLGLTGDSRVLQATLAFSVIVLSTQGLDRGRMRLLGFVALLIATAICFLDGARTASAVIIIASGALAFRLVMRRQWRDLWLPLTQVGLLVSSAFLSTRGEPVTGGDAGLSVAGLTINTTGRAALAAENLKAITLENGPVSEVLLGHGVGHSHEISILTAASDTPLNEFVRVSVDLGLVGLLLLLTGLCFLALVCIRLLLSGHRAESLEASLLLMGLLAFALTENMLSYSWILMPVFILLGSLDRLTRKKRRTDLVESSGDK